MILSDSDNIIFLEKNFSTFCIFKMTQSNHRTCLKASLRISSLFWSIFLLGVYKCSLCVGGRFTTMCCSFLDGGGGRYRPAYCLDQTLARTSQPSRVTSDSTVTKVTFFVPDMQRPTYNRRNAIVRSYRVLG